MTRFDLGEAGKAKNFSKSGFLPFTQPFTNKVMAPPRSAVAAKIQKEQDDLLPSEDEEDEDFTLEAGEGDSGGSDSSDSERESGPVSKRTKVEEKPAEPA